ncbi:MAG: hypothetical protein GF355_09170 [Candidatus Eisenbacteria bacterium]|nr:hypothetical protein [Candidatus Eisenbacteria bacterium]
MPTMRTGCSGGPEQPQPEKRLMAPRASPARRSIAVRARRGMRRGCSGSFLLCGPELTPPPWHDGSQPWFARSADRRAPRSLSAAAAGVACGRTSVPSGSRFRARASTARRGHRDLQGTRSLAPGAGPLPHPALRNRDRRCLGTGIGAAGWPPPAPGGTGGGPWPPAAPLVGRGRPSYTERRCPLHHLRQWEVSMLDNRKTHDRSAGVSIRRAVAVVAGLYLITVPAALAGPFDTVQESVLENGLKVITAENHTSPTASVQVWYRVGSRNETHTIAGASHLLEHMMFKGTEKHPTGEFDRIVQSNGMENNAFTSHDFTCYFENTAGDRLEVVFELEADRMQGVVLPEEEFRSEMGVVRNERRQTHEDPPFGLLTESVNAAAFQAHSYRWPIIGWMSVLETITRDDVMQYYRTYYRPNNAVLVVTGDVTHEQVVELAEKTFGKHPRGPEVPPVRVQEPEQLGEKTVRVHKETQLPGVIIAYHAPPSDHFDTKVLQVIENVIFIGESSRCYQACVYGNPLALYVSGGIYFRKDPSTFWIQAMCRPGATAEALRDTIFTVLEDLKTEPVPEDELQKAKNQILAGEMFAQTRNFELGYRLGSWECRSSWRDGVRFAEDCLSVTAEDIQRVAREIFRPQTRTVGILVPKPVESAELQQ